MVDASTCSSSANSLELYQYPSGGFIALQPLSQCISRGEALLLGAGERGQNEDAVAQAAVAQALEFPLHWRIRLVLRTGWRRAVAGLVFAPSRTAFTQRSHGRRELPRLTDDVASVTEGVHPRKHVLVRLLFGQSDDSSHDFADMFSHVELIYRGGTESAGKDAEVCD
jgi:hypothetical protein